MKKNTRIQYFKICVKCQTTNGQVKTTDIQIKQFKKYTLILNLIKPVYKTSTLSKRRIEY